MEKIFSGADLDVFIDRVGGDGVVFCFSGFKSYDSKNPRYGDGFVQQAGLSGVFFVAKRDHWWQTSEIYAAIEIANRECITYSRRFTYGQSMGGLGAVLYSRELSSFYIATAPQLTIDSRRAPLHPVWSECISKFKSISDNIPDKLLALPGGVIIYDPRDGYDRAHAKILSSAVGNHLSVIVPFATHYIPRALAEMGILKKIIIDIFHCDTVDTAGIRKIIRRERLRSATYVQRISLVLSRRPSPLLLNVFRAYVAKHVMREGSSFSSLKHLADILNAMITPDVAPIPARLTSGIKSAMPRNDLRPTSVMIGSYIATGSDPQISIQTSGEIRSGFQLKAVFYSSIASRASLYYSTRGSGYSQQRAISFPTHIGLNQNVFLVKVDGVDPIVRFDPSEGEGFIGINYLAVSEIN